MMLVDGILFALWFAMLVLFLYALREKRRGDATRDAVLTQGAAELRRLVDELKMQRLDNGPRRVMTIKSTHYTAAAMLDPERAAQVLAIAKARGETEEQVICAAIDAYLGGPSR